MTAPIRFRTATRLDLPAILKIEAVVFGRPWEPSAWEQELARPIAYVEVADAGRGRVVGYSCTWHVVAAGETEGHLLRVAVDPGHQRRGIGRDLVEAVKRRAEEGSVTRVLLEVAASNAGARRLYETAGFCQLARRPGYYKVPPDDALVMQWGPAVHNRA